jgi:integrase
MNTTGHIAMKLTDAKIRASKPLARPYLVADGRGLALRVSPSGARSWYYRYRFNGRANRLSLGEYPTVTLSEARERHIDMRRQLAQGIDPSAMRKQAVVEAMRAVLLGDYAPGTYAQYADEHKLSAGTRDAYSRALGYYVAAIGNAKPVRDITAADVHAASKSVLERGHETAKKGLQALRHVFAHAMATSLVPFDPAQAVKLPKPKHSKQHRLGATTQDAMRGVLQAIERAGLARPVYIALRILAAVFPRPNELCLATWGEIDLDGAMWRVPAERTKMRKEHVIPMPTQVVAMLRELRGASEPAADARVFAKVSDSTLRSGLKAAGLAGIQQPHGFRASASTLLHEMGESSDVIEMALAHAVPGVKGVYNRAHLLPQRKEMLQRWADHLDSLTRE